VLGRLIAAAMLVIGCNPVGPVNGPYTQSIADGVQPSRSVADAISISRAYLDAQTPEIAAPEQHIEPHITGIWAVAATDAHRIDGCIPDEASTAVVWVTRGVGDYLNLRDLPWSQTTTQANADTPTAMTCGGPGPAGTIVIDDASGAILGVFPEISSFPHPTGNAGPGASVTFSVR
jgi:hypothetical protein